MPIEKSVEIEVPARARKRPKQERSVALVSALREACLEILETDGREALSVHGIADRAGVGVSSIYEYYPTLEALITDVFSQLKHQLRAAAIDRIQALPPEAVLDDGIEAVLRSGMEMLDRWVRADADLFAKYTRYDELVRLDLILTEKTHPATVVDSLFARFASEITARDHEMARYFTHQALLSLIRATALMHPEYLRDQGAVELLKGMIHAALVEPSDRGPVLLPGQE